MTIIRQPSLFSIQELYDMEPTQKYDAIISAIDMDAIYYEVSKKSRYGAPTCFREHSYRYDSYDSKYETLQYTQPKECHDCPLANEGICQKVFKMKITKDLRKYTAPARGSRAWQKIYNRRTVVERVNGHLKEFFQLNNVRYRTGKSAKIHFDIVTLIYNASKLAADRIGTQLSQNQAA